MGRSHLPNLKTGHATKTATNFIIPRSLKPKEERKNDLVEHLLCAKDCAKFITHIISKAHFLFHT